MQIIQNNFNFLVTLIEVDEEETPLEKKVKTEGDNDDAIVWEWEDDGHVWKQFSSNIMKEIEDAFKAEMKKTKIEINQTKFDIIFERMVQRNSKTFWERRIRVAPGENSEKGTTEKLEFILLKFLGKISFCFMLAFFKNV